VAGSERRLWCRPGDGRWVGVPPLCGLIDHSFGTKHFRFGALLSSEWLGGLHWIVVLKVKVVASPKNPICFPSIHPGLNLLCYIHSFN